MTVREIRARKVKKFNYNTDENKEVTLMQNRI